jgi:transposase
MDAMTIAVDLAKDVFEVAGANHSGHVVMRQRLTRAKFEAFLKQLPRGTEVVMETCGTAHYWGRQCHALQLQPVLLPAQYVRAYVRRNKTDRSDAAALLEARRSREIHVVPVKTADQQALHGLHAMRQRWQADRTARINAVRGLLREQGIALPLGAKTVARRVPALMDDATAAIPALLRPVLTALVAEIGELERRVRDLDRTLSQVATTDPVAQRLQTIPGIGVVIATSLLSNVPHIHSFRRGRQFASWLGLTPRVYASGRRQSHGGISKKGDRYLRALLTHGARSFLVNAQRRARTQQPPASRLHAWAVALAARRGQNKATSALANKLARIVWAVWHFDRDFTPPPSVPTT